MRILFFIGAVDILLSLSSYLYYRYNFVWGKSRCFALLYLFLAVNTIVSLLLTPTVPSFIVKLSAWLEGLWIAFTFYSLLLAILHGLCWCVTRLAGIKLPSAKITSAGLAFIIAFLAWGSWRAFHPVVRTEKIVTDKLPANSNYRLVLLTDLHLGRLLGKDYAEDMVQKINSLQPDAVLISGDLLDDNIIFVEQENVLASFNSLRSRYGVYACFGNHDYIDTPNRWQQLLQQHNFHVLRDASQNMDSYIKITGLNDFSRSPDNAVLKSLANGNEGYYSILLDHQPRKMETAAAAGYDLYLSGHTHTGQLFPNRLVTERLYKLDYGRRDFGSLTAITSSGYGFWGPPVRTEAPPEIVVIELTGK